MTSINSERESRWFGQGGGLARLEWGRRGARAAAERGDILVVVDVLSFSTTVATAVARGARIYPCGKGEDPEAIARREAAVVAAARQDVPAKGEFSLSPLTFLNRSLNTPPRVVLPSPNGAACTRYGRDVPRLYVGALVNAAAVAHAAASASVETGAAVTVLACGERWLLPNEDGGLRFAAEDYLGAGAILARLPAALPLSSEAALCAAAFLASRDRLSELLRGCGSGIELIARGYPGDVDHAARLDLYDAVPVLRDGVRLEPEKP